MRFPRGAPSIPVGAAAFAARPNTLASLAGAFALAVSLLAGLPEARAQDVTWATARAEELTKQGLAHAAAGDSGVAIRRFLQAIQLDAKYANAYVNRGAAWGEKGNLDRAIADFDEAIRLNPKEPQAYYNRGMAREMKRSLREALADFKMHSQLAPSNPDGRKAAARVQKKLSAR